MLLGLSERQLEDLDDIVDLDGRWAQKGQGERSNSYLQCLNQAVDPREGRGEVVKAGVDGVECGCGAKKTGEMRLDAFRMAVVRCCSIKRSWSWHPVPTLTPPALADGAVCVGALAQ